MTVQVIHEAFRKARAAVQAAEDELRGTRRSIDNRVRGYLGSGWTGPAADSFVPAWDDWCDGADDVLEGLTAMDQLLAATHADFRAQDEESQRRLDAISARIIDRLGG